MDDEEAAPMDDEEAAPIEDDEEAAPIDDEEAAPMKDAEQLAYKDAPNEEARRQIYRPINLPMYVPGNMNGRYFKICYCFRRMCYVKGMYPGFKGWRITYQHGYVVIGDWLYRFYLCYYPRPTRPPTRPTYTKPWTKPWPTRTRPQPTKPQ
ncbi:hypothetical protein ACROYT_G004194 [Oculina patagonica]